MSLRSRTRLTLVLSGCCEGVRFLHVAIAVCDGFDLVASKFCMLVWSMEVHFLHPIHFLFVPLPSSLALCSDSLPALLWSVLLKASRHCWWFRVV